mgnify:CR=1 FL=1
MIAAIIQARMGSERLSGKVLMDIEGKPMLQRVIGRVSDSQLIKDIVVATSTRIENKPIVDLARRLGCLVYAGSELDVLDRFYAAATLFEIDPIVRITGDCPLIDPQVIDETLGTFLNTKIDYLYNVPPFVDGLDVEVFSYEALKKTWLEATEREHVTTSMKNFSTKRMQCDNLLSQSCHWSVDTLEDLEFVRMVYRKLGDKFSWFEILGVL